MPRPLTPEELAKQQMAQQMKQQALQQAVNQQLMGIAAIIYANSIHTNMFGDELRERAKFAQMAAPYLLEAYGVLKNAKDNPAEN